MSKKLRTIAVLGLVILAGTAAYITFRNRPGLSPAEKSELLRVLTFRNEELEEPLRQTKYFADLEDTGKAARKKFVDFDQALNLWTRACADKSFDDVQRALADDYRPESRKAASVLSEAEKKPLTLAEKKRLFFDLTFHNEELRERLRLTKYFSKTAAAEEKSSAFWVDANQSYYLWRRACADKSFAEVKQSLGGRYQFVPASYYWQGR